MFRKRSGFKAEYRGFTLFATVDFDEWRTVLKGPDVIINGVRQFSEEKAKEHAIFLVDYYLKELQGDAAPEPAEVAWEPMPKGEWLDWRP